VDRLERTAGPQARQMLEQFLKRVKEVEAKYLEARAMKVSTSLRNCANQRRRSHHQTPGDLLIGAGDPSRRD
jgi:hypothetical protein